MLMFKVSFVKITRKPFFSELKKSYCWWNLEYAYCVPCRGVTPPHHHHDYQEMSSVKHQNASGGENPVLDLWGKLSIPSLPLFLDSLWPGVVVAV